MKKACKVVMIAGKLTGKGENISILAENIYQ